MIRLLWILIPVMILNLSCKEKAEERSGTVTSPPTVVNPYVVDTVYGELREKLSKDPNNPDLLYHLADLYERNGAYKEEIDALKKVVELKPDMAYAYFRMGTAYNRLNMPDEAIRSFKEAMRLMPENPVLYNNLAIAYGKKGFIDEEIANLKKAIALRPNYATARYNLGIAYFKKGNRNSAMEQYRKLLDIDKGMADMLLKEIGGNK